MIDLTPVVRAERLVCAGRLAIALSSLVAVTVDTADSATNRPVTIPLLIGFSLYAAAAALRQWRGDVPSMNMRKLSHALDVGVILLLNYFADAATSPFFAFFVFALISASIRFGAQMALVTTVAALVGYVGLGAYEGLLNVMTSYDRTRFMIRTGYLTVIAVFIQYLARYQDRLRGELAQIAAWPRDRADTLDEAVQQLLKRAARLFDAGRVLLVWEISDEPWVYAGYYDGQVATLTHHAPGDVLPVVDERAEGLAFITRDVDSRTTVHQRGGAVTLLGQSPINPQLIERYRIGSVLSVAFTGDIVTGRLFFLDTRNLSVDNLTLGNIVAHLIGTSMENQFVTWQLQHAAAADERLRVARDLHDGVVQSLAGAALHLQILERLIDEDPAQARAGLREIRELVTQDQRELRSYIAHLRPSMSRGEKDRSLCDKIVAAAGRIQRERSVKVDLTIDPYIDTVSEGMKVEIYNIVKEAMTNAAKHAQPSTITAEAALNGTRVVVRVSDDGHGFPFHGRYDLDALFELQFGPTTLKERIGALSGDLVIDSTSRGATLHIVLPRSLAEVDNGNARSGG